MKGKLLLPWIFCLILVSPVKSQPATFYPRGIGGGGSLYYPTFNPANDNEFYVSCDMSGLYHSRDFGLTYSLVDFRKLQVFGSSTYGFTNDPNIAYCNFNDGNDGYPVKTLDGGNTWTKITGYDIGSHGMVYRMSTNFDNPSQLLINSYGDILFSNNGGSSFSLVRHTANMGAGLIMGGVFWDGANIYIGTNEGIFYSSNSGSSFSEMVTQGMTSGQVIWSFAGARSTSGVRFVCIASNSSNTYNGIYPWEYWNFAKQVYVMDNMNSQWVASSSGIDFSNDFIMYVAMAHNDIQTVYLGGHDNALAAPLVLKSSNGGASWSKAFNTTNNSNIITGWEGFNGDKNWSWSETCFGISVSPVNSDKVLFGSFSNVEASADGGATWRQAYVNSSDQHSAGTSTPKNMAYHSIGLEITSCWQVYWQDSANMFGCFSDIGGIRSLDEGKTWGYQYSGFSVNTLYRITEDENKTLYGACSGVHDIYQSTHLKDATLDVSDGSGKIVFSTDKGATWSVLHQFNHPVYWLAIDPNNTDRMYASVIHFGGVQGSQQGGIYRTDNLGSHAGSTWIKLPNPPRTEGHPATISVLNDGKVVCSFSGRINLSGSFTASSGVFLYDPSTNSWTDVSDAGMDYWTQDVVIDPSDASQNTWYACVYSGWGGPPNGLGGLYKTVNRGTNWTKVTASQFDRVTSLTINLQNLSQSYLTTETQGLWLTETLHSASPGWNLVTSYPFRQPQRVFFNPFNPDEVWISSFGNGMMSGNLNSTGIQRNSEIKGNPIHVFPNPAQGDAMAELSVPVKTTGCMQLFDGSGKQVLSERIVLKQGKNLLHLGTGTFPDGVYSLLIVTGSGDKFSSKVIKK
jgi:hypothetical protein